MNNLPPSLQRSLVSLRSITKSYPRAGGSVPALRNVTLDVYAGEFLAVVGPSGSGKSTLLNIIGCMDSPTSGTLELLGKSVASFNESQRTSFRRDYLGFVFQHFGLIPTLTVAENVSLPALFAGRHARAKADKLLEDVGLTHRRDHKPYELSGGELQRAAIARALVNEPFLLLADEPTGNLDAESGQSVLDLFRQLNIGGVTILVVTHNPVLASAAHVQLPLIDGTLVRVPKPIPVRECAESPAIRT